MIQVEFTDLLVSLLLYLICAQMSDSHLLKLWMLIQSCTLVCQHLKFCVTFSQKHNDVFPIYFLLQCIPFVNDCKGKAPHCWRKRRKQLKPSIKAFANVWSSKCSLLLIFGLKDNTIIYPLNTLLTCNPSDFHAVLAFLQYFWLFLHIPH